MRRKNRRYTENWKLEKGNESIADIIKKKELSNILYSLLSAAKVV